MRTHLRIWKTEKLSVQQKTTMELSIRTERKGELNRIVKYFICCVVFLFCSVQFSLVLCCAVMFCCIFDAFAHSAHCIRSVELPGNQAIDARLYFQLFYYYYFYFQLVCFLCTFWALHSCSLQNHRAYLKRWNIQNFYHSFVFWFFCSCFSVALVSRVFLWAYIE